MVLAPTTAATRNGTPPEPERSASDLAPSTLLRYLPAIYSGDEFVGRFLRIFEDVHTPVRRMAGNLPSYFDPALAPPALQDLLAGWVGADVGGVLRNLPPEARGRLIREAVELHRWRGTKRGLRRALEIATGYTPLITDYGNGLVLGDDASLGTNTRLENGSPFRINVTFQCEPKDVHEGVVDAIIRRHRPAYVTHSVEFVEPATPS